MDINARLLYDDFIDRENTFTAKERERIMVPSFGMFDFLPVRVAGLAADDSERQGYLDEICMQSTEFGAGVRSESEALIEDNLRVALMYRF